MWGEEQRSPESTIHKGGDRKTAATYQSEIENAAAMGQPWNFINWGPNASAALITSERTLEIIGIPCVIGLQSRQ